MSARQDVVPGRLPDSAVSAVVIRALAENDLQEAIRLFRLAFGTYLKVPAPEALWLDRDYIRSRWRADHISALAADLGGQLVGSNFAIRWGSVGFFGPLTVDPDLWQRGIARQLAEAATACLDTSGVQHAGLFTFADSPKHVALYQKCGFWARYLTALMSAPVVQSLPQPRRWTRYSALGDAQKLECLKACSHLTEAIYDGLNLTAEINNVHEQELGDTVLVGDPVEHELQAFAICHHGPSSEAGDGTCLVKFGAAYPGSAAAASFDALLDTCSSYAQEVGAANLVVGADMGRHESYRHLIGRGFRTLVQGIKMHRPNEPAYSRPGAYVIEDWR